MSMSGEKPEVVAVPIEQPPVPPARNRRATAQRVREARDRLTSTSGTRPAFDHELLRQYAQTRLSASFVVMLLPDDHDIRFPEFPDHLFEGARLTVAKDQAVGIVRCETGQGR